MILKFYFSDYEDYDYEVVIFQTACMFCYFYPLGFMLNL